MLTIKDFLKFYSSGRVNVKCPVDNMRIKTGELFEDNAFRREVMSLCVKCNNYRQGCLWTGEWRNLQDHLNICDFIYVRCQYGCGLSLLKQTQNDHEAICERRPVECQDCHIQIAFADLTKHQVLICQNFLVQCAVCGQGGLKRKEISNHTDVNKGDCPETVVPCQYTALGCQHQQKRRNLPEHYKEATDHHVSLLVQHISEQNKHIDRLEKNISQLHIRQEDSDKIIEEQHEQLLALKQEIVSSKSIPDICYNGMIHWMVPITVKEKNQFTSQSFYTGCPGYKVSSQLELVGHRDGSDFFSSFFIILEEGKFDQDLIFPFNAVCQVTVYDVSEDLHARQHFTTTIQCKEVSRQKSEQSHNSGRGKLKFMKSSEILSPRFTRDGYLYMDIKVNHCPSMC